MNNSKVERIFKLLDNRVLSNFVSEKSKRDMIANGDKEYIKELCISCSDYAYKQIERLLPSELHQEVSYERYITTSVERIKTETEAYNTILNSNDRKLNIKIIQKFWLNNEDIVFDLIQKTGELFLINSLSEKSERLIYKLFINNNFNGYEINTLLNYVPNPSQEFITNILSNDNISNYVKTCVLDIKDIKDIKMSISESLATKLLNNSDFDKRKILTIVSSTQNPSNEFLYKIISDNIEDKYFIDALLTRCNIPDIVLYNCIFNPSLYDAESYRFEFINKILNSEFENSVDAIQAFINKPTNDAEIEGRKQNLLQMYSKNDEVLVNIYWKLLSDKYVNNLGMEKLTRIASFPQIERLLLNLNEKEFYIFSKIIKSDILKDFDEYWESILESLLKNIKSCSELINSIDNVEQIDLNNLVEIILCGNGWNVSDIKEITNLDNIKQQTLRNAFNNKNIDKIKQYLFLLIFGRNISTDFLEEYQDGIKSIDNESLVLYFELIKKIFASNDIEELEKIYNEFADKNYKFNFFKLENDLKKEFSKLIQKDLLDVSKLTKISDNVYDAGVDFNIIIHSLGSFSSKNDGTNFDDYFSSWNRPKMGTQHFCASYIRNDMLATAPINNVCYGFSNLSDDSLLLMGPSDLSSSSWTTQLDTSSQKNARFLNSDDLINETISSHNEVDFKRIQNGKKKQPDYILFFKRNSSEELSDEDEILWQKSIQASKDFNDLPIVVVDIEKCLESEREKARMLLNHYQQVPSSEKLTELYYVIKNNRMTTQQWGGEFFPELDLTDISHRSIDNELIDTILQDGTYLKK